MGATVYTQVATTEKSEFWRELPHYGMVLFAFVLPLSTAGTNIVLGLFMLAWLASGSVKERARALWSNPLARYALMIFSLFLGSAWYAEAPAVDIVKTVTKLSKLLYLPFFISMMDEKTHRRVPQAFLAAVFLTVLLAALRELGWLWRFRVQAAPFRDSISTGLLAAFSAFWVAHYGFNTQKTHYRLFWLGFLALCLFHVFFIGISRSAQVVFLFLTMLFFVQRCSWRQMVFGAVFLLSIIGVAATQSSFFQKRVIEAVQLGDYSVTDRLEFYQNTWSMIKQHPWVGTGVGSFPSHYPNTRQEPLANPHNEYLHVAAQLGILGLGFFAWVLYQLIRLSAQLPVFERHIAHGTLLAMLVGCLFNCWLIDFMPGYWFVLLLAWSFGGLKYER